MRRGVHLNFQSFAIEKAQFFGVLTAPTFKTLQDLATKMDYYQHDTSLTYR
jgi:hypothetical protein